MRLQLGHFARPKLSGDVVDEFLERKLVYTELWKRCVLNSETRRTPSQQRYSSSSLELVRVSMLAASKERRLYRRAHCEGQMDVVCPIAYKKLSPTEHALAVQLEEQLPFETIYFLRCLAEYELALESRETESTLLQQASSAFWEGVSNKSELSAEDCRARLQLALEMLGGGEGSKGASISKRQKQSRQGKVVSTRPSMLFKLAHTIERVSVTLLLDSPSNPAGGRGAAIPFLGLVQDDIRVQVDVDMQSSSAESALVAVTMQDMHVLELLPVADNALSCTGSVRSQAASAWSQFRRNRSRKIVSRYSKERPQESVHAHNASPFSQSNVLGGMAADESNGSVVLRPLLQVTALVPLDTAESCPTVKVTVDELEVYLSPSCKGWIDSLIVFAAPPAGKQTLPTASAANDSCTGVRPADGAAPGRDVKLLLDDIVESFDGFTLPLTLEGCFMPIRIVVSDHIDGNDTMGVFDDHESLDSASLTPAGEGRAVLVIDTGRMDVKVGQQLKLSSHTESLVASPKMPSTTTVNFINITISDICVFITEYTGPCAWRHVDRDIVDRGSILSRSSMQVGFQVESKILETIRGNDLSELVMLTTPLVSVNLKSSDIQMIISEGKLHKLVELVDSFMTQSEGMGMEFDNPHPTKIDFHDTAVLAGLEQVPFGEEKDVFFDTLTEEKCDSGRGATELPDQVSAAVEFDRSDISQLEYYDEDEDFFSVGDVDEDRGSDLADLVGFDDSSTVNDLEVSVSSLQDEIGEAETERVALMASIRILELGKGKKKSELTHARDHLNRLDRRLKNLRSDYVGAMIELTAAREQRDQKKVQGKDKGGSVGMSKTLSYESVAAFVRGLGDSALQSRGRLEQERERIRQMHQLKKVMVEFKPVGMSRKGEGAKDKLWRKDSYALLSLSMHLPNIVIDITSSTPRQSHSASVHNGQSSAYGDEDIVLRFHTRDISMSFMHKSSEAIFRTTIREVLGVSFASLALNCRDLYIEDYYDNCIMKLSPVNASTPVISPRGYRQPANAVKCTYDLVYGGNILQSPASLPDAHKISTSISLLETTVQQDLAVRLCFFGESIVNKVMASGLARGACEK